MTKDASSSSTNISTEQNGSRETNDNNTVEAMASAVADGRRKSAPALCPTDDDTVVLGNKQPRIGQKGGLGEEGRLRTAGKEIRNKQSWDYIWRTGLAGGLAGSAVCILVTIFYQFFLRILQEEISRASRAM